MRPDNKLSMYFREQVLKSERLRAMLERQIVCGMRSGWDRMWESRAQEKDWPRSYRHHGSAFANNRRFSTDR